MQPVPTRPNVTISERNGTHQLSAGPCSASMTRQLLREDLTRYSGEPSIFSWLRHFLFTPGYQFTVLLRWTGFWKRHQWGRYIIYPALKLLKLRCQYRFGITISEDSLIGGGLFINRFGGIYFHRDVTLGRNVNVTHGVVLGQVNSGSKRGVPSIGDRVFLGSGAKIIGRVHIGDDASIGANALIASDVPPMGVMGAPQAELLSFRGSGAYINNKAD